MLRDEAVGHFVVDGPIRAFVDRMGKSSTYRAILTIEPNDWRGEQPRTLGKLASWTTTPCLDGPEKEWHVAAKVVLANALWRAKVPTGHAKRGKLVDTTFQKTLQAAFPSVRLLIALPAVLSNGALMRVAIEP